VSLGSYRAHGAKAITKEAKGEAAEQSPSTAWKALRSFIPCCS